MKKKQKVKKRKAQNFLIINKLLSSGNKIKRGNIKVINSTKQFLHDHIAQHHSSKESAIYEHNKNHNDTAKFSCKILAQAANVKELVFKEGLLIKKCVQN